MIKIVKVDRYEIEQKKKAKNQLTQIEFEKKKFGIGEIRTRAS